MKMMGSPVFMASSWISAILRAVASPTAPPATVKSWLAAYTGRPSTRP